MRLRHLESALTQVQPFASPQVRLEQYPTPAPVAARVCLAAAEREDVEGQEVLDLGTGTGMLGLGCGLLGAAAVLGADVDPAALAAAAANAETLGEHLDLLQCDVASLALGRGLDTAIMNPPFGTKHNKGADWMFVRQGMAQANVVYSLHKSSTRRFLLRGAEAEGWGGEVLAELRFPIPDMYKFHKKKSVDVEVDLVRFWHVA